eukprot:CAMPEP_0171543794 /NCGR_PEP_ID=MMETSP0960-20121227/3137_1 /TAXON_ID=87120 /ORGANISM="Aurantiochytrium limacinum, Strain ATCCMYA-1381" /LENGTH=700 /DNA_ID=CAMNT_0012091519 /DNA_START=39 /DNA_END=2145 /DNA_ORIENTATION=-
MSSALSAWWAVAQLYWLETTPAKPTVEGSRQESKSKQADSEFNNTKGISPGSALTHHDRTSASLATITAPSQPTVRPRASAWLRLAAVLLLQVLRGKTGTLVAASTRQVLAAAGTAKLKTALLQKLLLLLFLSPLDAVYKYVLRGLRVDWSNNLTNRLLRDYVELACARLSKPAISSSSSSLLPSDARQDDIDPNIDQHVAEGVEKFVDLSLDLFLESVQAGIHLYFFTGMLAEFSPYLASTTKRLALLGTVATLTIGRRLPELYRNEREAVNDFRYALTRGLENAESIAFYDGAAQEVETLRIRNDIKQECGWVRKAQRDFVQTFSSTYRKIAGLVPFYMLAVSTLPGEHHQSNDSSVISALAEPHGHSHASTHGHSHDHSHSHSHGGPATAEDEGVTSEASKQLAIVMQAADAFDEVLFHLMILAENINDFSRLKAVSEQLSDMLQFIEDQDNSQNTTGSSVSEISLAEVSPPAHASDGKTSVWLALDNLTIRFNHRVLIQSLSLSLTNHHCLLITGGSGFGKTTLLRCIQGLVKHGEGHIIRPSKDDILFIPQQPYMPLGTLREQLFYPLPRDQVPLDRDLEARRLLHVVGLGYLEQRFALGLDTVSRWADELSVGEQQRIAFCRIALNKPRFVFLDEATSALDAAAEEKVHALLASSCEAYVSVGHRATLERFHSHKLHLHGSGAWEMTELFSHKD